MNLLIILLFIFNLILSILVFRLYKMVGVKQPKRKDPRLESKKNIDYKDYIHSMEFNKKLDGLIIPLLHKNSNEDIVIKVINVLNKNDSIAKLIPGNELKEHVVSMVSCYNNKYKKQEEDIQELKPIDTNQEFVDNPKNLNEINLTNVLNNFYE